MLGMYEGRTPRFVKRYAEIAHEIGDAVAQYAHEVRTGEFPEEQHTYSITADELKRFEEAIG
jgi:3-methyl-2-oxobutanoate hydroxymethyltransferase